MKLKEFKNEFRLICTDTWGDALESWFECAGHMHSRNLPIPNNWKYSAGAGSGMDIDSYFHAIFMGVSDEELINIGNFLFRYCEFLRYKGINY